MKKKHTAMNWLVAFSLVVMMSLLGLNLYHVTTTAEEKIAASHENLQAIQQLTDRNVLLTEEVAQLQECVLEILFILPEERRAMTVEDLREICPPLRVDLDPTSGVQETNDDQAERSFVRPTPSASQEESASPSSSPSPSASPQNSESDDDNDDDNGDDDEDDPLPDPLPSPTPLPSPSPSSAPTPFLPGCLEESTVSSVQSGYRLLEGQEV